MKKITLFIFCFLVAAASLHAGGKFQKNATSRGTSMSPDGKYIVGTDPTTIQWGLDLTSGFRSFLWNTATNEQTWLTSLDQADESSYAKSGSFTDVNNDGVIVGYFKDPAYKLTMTEMGSTNTLPLNVAAVWKDGKVTSLGLGDFKLSDFNCFADGTIATSVSADGKKVTGIVVQGNYAKVTPCSWEFDNATSKWNFKRYAVPAGSGEGWILGLSDDGGIACGRIKTGDGTKAIFWTSPSNYTVIELLDKDKDELGGEAGNAFQVSPNGQFIVFTCDGRTPLLYRTDGARYSSLGTYTGVQSVTVSAVSDEGDVVGTYNYGNSWEWQYTRPFWNSPSSLYLTLGFDYYLSLYAPELKLPDSYSFKYELQETTTIKCISADGRIVMGNNENESYYIKTDAKNVVIPWGPEKEKIKAKVTALKEVTVSWPKANAFMWYVPKSYNVYCDGVVIANIPAEETGSGGGGGGEPTPFVLAASNTLSYIHKNAANGTRLYTVTAVFESENDGSLQESPRYDPISVMIANTFAIPFFDDFDTMSPKVNYWTQEVYEPGNLGLIAIGLPNWGCPMYTGLQNSCALYTTADSDTPYSYAIVSRYLDATKLDQVYLSFAKRYSLLNSNDWPLDGDSLSIDVTTDDGVSWREVKRFVLKDGTNKRWNFETLELTPYVARTMFKVRIRPHGEGKALLVWSFDYFKVGASPEVKAPEGMLGRLNGDKALKLWWKDKNGAYALNYLDNYYNVDVFSLSLGDEGKEFIAANRFDPSDIYPFDGKYITSVRTFINQTSENNFPTHASIVIYQNGELVREQDLGIPETNVDLQVKLNEPVRIDGSKSLTVGMKIYDYDEEEWPLVYMNTRNFVAGKSDLYSQDGGKTWKKLSDFYAGIKGQETDGYCSWEITACVTDGTDADVPQPFVFDLYAYNVYRDGVRINEGFIGENQAKFVDQNPVEGATYQVVGFYRDGLRTEYSEPWLNTRENSIQNTQSGENEFAVYPNPATDRIFIDNAFDKAVLVTVNGQVILETQQSVLSVSGLPSGVYFLKIQSGAKTEVKKVMIE